MPRLEFKRTNAEPFSLLRQAAEFESLGLADQTIRAGAVMGVRHVGQR